ncbi:hypothetical protein VTN31DRAFT_7274 [Thermomyces dupontii]|uniref:uncharacterized protein n=1 Tax=Talaromyces thermophilus TaxID=28565 RepID=UPI00374321B0
MEIYERKKKNQKRRTGKMKTSATKPGPCASGNGTTGPVALVEIGQAKEKKKKKKKKKKKVESMALCRSKQSGSALGPLADCHSGKATKGTRWPVESSFCYKTLVWGSREIKTGVGVDLGSKRAFATEARKEEEKSDFSFFYFFLIRKQGPVIDSLFKSFQFDCGQSLVKESWSGLHPPFVSITYYVCMYCIVRRTTTIIHGPYVN